MRTIALVFAIILCCAAVFADGMLLPAESAHSLSILPNELFTVKYHHVNVTINDQLANTKVDQIFHNDSRMDREGVYVFPMPEGSAINKFSMFAGEKEIAGKILDKAEARGIYESIVRKRRDPAILEYMDRNMFRASVYPVPANGDKQIRLDYSEIVPKSGNSYRYVYSLSTERFSAKPLQDCKVTIKLHSKRAITNIYSPTHQIKVDRTSDRDATVTWSVQNAKPDTDLVLYYSLSDSNMGIDLIPYREKDGKGYYLLLANPRAEVNRSTVLPKNVVFVFDRTGSMAGEKIEQAKDAIKFCVNSLKPNDQFNIITFNESAKALFAELEKPTSDRKHKALEAIDALDADGSTDIDQALTMALKQFKQYGNQRNYIIFLTDGQPTAGKTDPNTIISDTKENDRNNVRIFAFGVGYDVNAHLLDQISQTSKGDTDYVRPRENIEAKVSTFFGKVSEPLLSDIQLTISGGDISDTYPSKDLPDIFRGSQLVVLGRYNASGKVNIQLSGIANGKRRTFTVASTLPQTDDANSFIPLLWAARKIGYLLDQIRLQSNQELIDEVVRLSKEYGIPTEYTSFLADDRNFTSNLSSSYTRARKATQTATQQATGQWAIAQSSNAQMSRNNAQVASASPAPGGLAAADKVRIIGSVAANGRVGGSFLDNMDQTVIVANVQNVAQKTFYQRGQYWEDANLKPNQQFVKIKQFSDAHFKLLANYPKLSQYSTLGNVRLLLSNNRGIEIGPDGKDKLTDREISELLKGA